jgi:hypothetical protein
VGRNRERPRKGGGGVIGWSAQDNRPGPHVQARPREFGPKKGAMSGLGRIEIWAVAKEVHLTPHLHDGRSVPSVRWSASTGGRDGKAIVRL